MPRNLYRESFALIVGINDYQIWPKLRYAVNDANAIEEALVTRFGFKRENIRKLLNGDATRVTIDLENSVEFTSGRIANPERIFFDLHAARLAPEVARSSIHVDGDLLTAVRVAQNHAGVVRVAVLLGLAGGGGLRIATNPAVLSKPEYG